jgi:hypothetical protein
MVKKGVTWPIAHRAGTEPSKIELNGVQKVLSRDLNQGDIKEKRLPGTAMSS